MIRNKGDEQEEDMDEDDEYAKALEEAKKLSMEGYQDEPTVTKKEDEDKKEDDYEGVINEDFLGELMQDLGVPMAEDALKD